MNIIEERVVLPAGALVFVKGSSKSACTLPEQVTPAIEALADGCDEQHEMIDPSVPHEYSTQAPYKY